MKVLSIEKTAQTSVAQLKTFKIAIIFQRV